MGMLFGKCEYCGVYHCKSKGNVAAAIELHGKIEKLEDDLNAANMRINTLSEELALVKKERDKALSALAFENL